MIRNDYLIYYKVCDFLAWKEVRKVAKETTDNLGFEPEHGSFQIGSSVPSWCFAKTLLNNSVDESLRTLAKKVLDYSLPPFELNMDLKRIKDTRLAMTDRKTNGMTREEYLTWTDKRQASFTYKKGKKFRDWITDRFLFSHSNHISYLKNLRMGDEVVEILGFIAYETVGTIVSKCIENRIIRSSPIVHDNFSSDVKFEKTKQLGRDIEQNPIQPTEIMESLFLIPNLTKTNATYKSQFHPLFT